MSYRTFVNMKSGKSMRKLSDQEIERRKSLEALKEMGIDPYPPEGWEVSHTSEEIKDQFRQGVELGEVSLAGRIMARRIMGKASFVVLQDHRGKIQLYVARDILCPGEDKTLYNEVFKKYLDIGDIIGVRGEVFATRTGETTVRVKELKLLAKSLRPLPIVKVDAEGKVHDAFTDPELRYRQRYVDLIVNPHVREIFIRRAKIIASIRKYFDSRGWLEVETPILQPVYGGASARPFVTHHHALDIDLYLRISNELYLKRLLVGGYEGVYEIGKMFRNEGMDRTHNPEFTLLEMYVAYRDYHWMMEMVEDLLEYVTTQTTGSTTISYGGHTIDFKGPYKRMSMTEAIRQYSGYDIRSMRTEELDQACRQLGIAPEKGWTRGKYIDELFEATVQPHLIQPTYITDYPIELTPLAKKHRSEEGLVERFELFVAGKELANAYTELNDPIDQRQRLEEQARQRAAGDEEAMQLDEDFLRALEYGMPPTAGLGIGIDRLTMLLTDQHAIQEVLLFPQMKPEKPQSKSETKDANQH